MGGMLQGGGTYCCGPGMWWCLQIGWYKVADAPKRQCTGSRCPLHLEVEVVGSRRAPHRSSSPVAALPSARQRSRWCCDDVTASSGRDHDAAIALFLSGGAERAGEREKSLGFCSADRSACHSIEALTHANAPGGQHPRGIHPKPKDVAHVTPNSADPGFDHPRTIARGSLEGDQIPGRGCKA